MTPFEQWWIDNGIGAAYEDFARSVWNAASEQAAKKVDAMADHLESDQEPSAMVAWVRREAKAIRSNK